ncbi:glutamate ABC transporter substrate-binding protein [Actinomadura xylanilytica]|uniref:glutamate ABC transporter substrate-binding protein n=1 Tax=Actinomadura xylanilytica TaxID=887459 RepID=UPI00255AA9A7|nr:glutamate ABC transporter substrate-binding protein [Actinomadura xylanilytica]MDL4771610.1 glutamate ABC transporter substrate-binding protein [Actinomadura xylanilytica]
MRARLTGSAALAAAVLLAAGACGVAGAESSITAKDELVVGVNPDQPGVGLKARNGDYVGFDPDIARAVAKRLGGPAKKLRFKAVTSETRERMLKDGDVDMVVASYSITPDRKADVTFAGPYYVAHQDILVRATDAASVPDVRGLRGKSLCEVPGSVSFPRVKKERGVPVRPVRAAKGYGECFDLLAQKKVFAVSTDDLILAGQAARVAKGEAPGPELKIVNAPFSEEPYGIGVRKGDIDGCEKINKAITELYQQTAAGRDSEAVTLLKRWFGPAHLNTTSTVPQFEGCD